MTPPNESTWEKIYQFLFGRGTLEQAQGQTTPVAPAGGSVSTPVPGMDGKSMADLAKEAAERAKKQQPGKPAKPAKPVKSTGAAAAGFPYNPDLRLAGPSDISGYSDQEIARARSGRSMQPDAGDMTDVLLTMLGAPGAGAGAGALGASLTGLGKVKRFSVDAKALTMPEIDALLTRALQMGSQTGGAAAQRFGQQITNAKRAVYNKAIADPEAKWSVQEILNMLSESTSKGTVKRALAEWIDNPAAQIQQGGRLYPIAQQTGQGLRGWITGQK